MIDIIAAIAADMIPVVMAVIITVFRLLHAFAGASLSFFHLSTRFVNLFPLLDLLSQ